MSYKPFTTEYTWQIIDDIKEYLEETNKDQTTLDTLDLCHLIGEIEKLNNRNRELYAEKNKLNNIINELYTKANDTNITSLDLREYILNNLGVDK